MKWLYIFLGFLAVALGLLGAVLPVLPTTPFLLLALYFFAKSSERLHNWFLQTSLYDNYLREFNETRAMTMRAKISILTISGVMMAISFYFMPTIYGRIALILLVLVQYWFFFFWIKTAPNK
ncbi:YbaN family protein [Pasteurellaceae bacterium HPA106]|uniref:YbaN family protein n=1 Tax=Spirabiliibacterium pneumoniae TaxID=221400 RepID=UPI001AAE031B|nr:YbaN family protein [Spirabiliibacterium pneumoniae]MBE2895865.1 YbaN family protein [Spirabiliibacterium pneumoniae]